MKKCFCLFITVYICFMACFVSTLTVSAASVKEVKERWYDTGYYPLYQGSEEWHKYNMVDTLDILNPPEDLLLSMSTEELAQLMLDYPLLGQITTYFDTEGNQDYVTFFCFVELNCDIFYELMRREEGISCLLEAYRTQELDVEQMNKGVFSSIETERMWFSEILGCQFIRYYANQFTDDEYVLANQIIEEKKEVYASFKESFLYYLDLPEIEQNADTEVKEIRTNYLSLEEVQEKEDRLLKALNQMQSIKDNTQTAAEEGDFPKSGIIIVSIGVPCLLIGGILIYKGRRK